MEHTNRKSVNDKLKVYDYLANENDFIEVTEWSNGDGVDISISTNETTTLISLTRGELEAITYLTKALDYGSK